MAAPLKIAVLKKQSESVNLVGLPDYRIPDHEWIQELRLT